MYFRRRAVGLRTSSKTEAWGVAWRRPGFLPALREAKGPRTSAPFKEMRVWTEAGPGGGSAPWLPAAEAKRGDFPLWEPRGARGGLCESFSQEAAGTGLQRAPQTLLSGLMAVLSLPPHSFTSFRPTRGGSEPLPRAPPGARVSLPGAQAGRGRCSRLGRGLAAVAGLG